MYNTEIAVCPVSCFVLNFAVLKRFLLTEGQTCLMSASSGSADTGH